MKQLLCDLRKGIVKLQPEHAEDLFSLSQIIEKGDTLEGRTLRKIKLDRGGDDRKTAVVTRPVFLSITVKEVEFTGETLRVSGTVNEGKEDIPRGAHHTITVEIHDTVAIIKEQWPGFLLEKLKEACSGEPPKILIAILDRDEAYIALMKRVKYEILVHLGAEPEKKAMKQTEKDFYAEVAKQITLYDERHNFDAVIIASPAFFKDEVAKRLGENIRGRTVLCTSSSVGKNGIDEVLKREEAASALAKARIGSEMKHVQTLFAEIGRASGKAVYGLDACKKAVEAGAVAELIVSEGFIQKLRAEGKYEPVAAVMKAADMARAEVRIISSEHDGGRQLDGLGGIGAVLRYAMHEE